LLSLLPIGGTAMGRRGVGLMRGLAGLPLLPVRGVRRGREKRAGVMRVFGATATANDGPPGSSV
jgi:hypothetical protein